MHLTRASLLTFLLLCWLDALPATGQSAGLLPQDEASRQPDFFTFRARLLVSLAQRDTLTLLNGIASEIRNTFGDDNGVDAFRRRWRLTEPDSELWSELATVLALGGTFQNDSTFVAPYTFSRWPAEYDAFDYLAVVGSGVRVRGEPSLTAPVLTRLGFEVVQRARTPRRSLTTAEAALWEPIQLRDGRIGYIARRWLRSPVGYRAVFMRRGLEWIMVSFIAGD